MRGITHTSSRPHHAYNPSKVTVSVATKQSLLDSLTRYKVGVIGKPRNGADCFSSSALATALSEVNKHLVVLPDEGQPSIKQHQKARWVYCCNPQQLVMLSTLLPQIGDELEYFYLGGMWEQWIRGVGFSLKCRLADTQPGQTHDDDMAIAR